MLLAHVVPTVVNPQRIVSRHFFSKDQFSGLAGSSGPSKVAIKLESSFEDEPAPENLKLGETELSGPSFNTSTCAFLALFDGEAISQVSCQH